MVDKKKSEFEGYYPEDAYKNYTPEEKRRSQAQTAQKLFEQDYENMKTTYDTYRRPADPDAKEMSKRLGQADEKAASRIRESQEAARSELRREAKEPRNYAKGGSISSASKRADGIAMRGKTRGTMVMCGGGYMKGKK